jgi:hypothetical protein
MNLSAYSHETKFLVHLLVVMRSEVKDCVDVIEEVGVYLDADFGG